MEDIFRQFFGGGARQRFQQRSQQQQQPPRYRQRENDAGVPEFDWSQVNWMPLLQMVLMLLMFLLPTFFSMYSMSSSKNKFSLQQNKDYPVEMVTLNGSTPVCETSVHHGEFVSFLRFVFTEVKYYLPRDFDTAYYFSTFQDQLSFEQPILEAYMHAKRLECQFEQNHKLKMQNNAEREDQKQKAHDFSAPSCGEVNRLRSFGVR
jgi:hypothetical protein